MDQLICASLSHTHYCWYEVGMCDVINTHTHKQYTRTIHSHTHRNRKIVVDAMWETGETSVERGKNIEKKGLVQ